MRLVAAHFVIETNAVHVCKTLQLNAISFAVWFFPWQTVWPVTKSAAYCALAESQIDKRGDFFWLSLLPRLAVW